MVTCPRCQTDNADAAKFCSECGSSLHAAAGARAREERKVVSVFFADLVGFTSDAERMDPEEVRALLQPYHASLRAELERFGGTVEKFIGDAVMAVFGAPVAHEDDPERAVRAALAIRDSLVAEGRLHVRIGITTGEALVAVEARPQAGEGMAAGDVVNTAARLQAVAPIDGILVDEATTRATSRVITYAEHAPVTVKGKSEPITVRVAVSARSRFGVDVRQIGQAPLVGRAHELALLVGALERATREREPQLVTLIGVPGIGKSRLVWELFQHIERGRELIQWRQGRSLPYAEGISFWALGEMVKAEAGILETDPGGEAEEKLARAVSAVELDAADAEWIERHLRPLVGLEAGADAHADRSGEAFSAWTRFFESLADRRPLVLIFEDLHWADDQLLDFLDHLVEWATSVPLLIIGTTRTELLSRRPGWGGGKPNALTISLSPLSHAETSRLVAALVERALIPARMHEQVLERAQGNPLYAEEFARWMAEHGTLEHLPESVQGIIAARLDALARDDKELLQDAAVVGKVFWSGALAEMSGGGRERAQVEHRLHSLERKEFVRRERRSSVEGETEYAFRHILVRDVAYGQIPRAARAERHIEAASWIESLGRPADHAELLAQHYLAAMELARATSRPIDQFAERARLAFRAAAERSSSLNAFGASARYYALALELTPPDAPQRPIDLLRYGNALWYSEVRGEDVVAEAEAAFRAAGNLEGAAEAAVVQAKIAWDLGDSTRAAEHRARADALVDELPPSRGKAVVLSDLSRFHMLASETDAAVRRGRQAVALARDLGLDQVRAHALNNIGSARTQARDLGGIADLEESIALSTAIRSPDAARALNNLAGAVYSSGDPRRARRLWADALARARELGHGPVLRFQRGNVPSTAYEEGRWDDALQACDEFIAEIDQVGSSQQETAVRYVRAHIRYARGDVSGAISDAERSLAVARRQDPQNLLVALPLAAWLAYETGRTPAAQTLLDEFMTLFGKAFTDTATMECAIVLDALGRHADVVRLAENVTPGAWADVFSATADGRFDEAAEIVARLDVAPAAALLRRRAAERLLADGLVTEAHVQLEKAAEFWMSVGATQHLRSAEELLAGVAGGVGPRRRQRRDTSQATRPRCRAAERARAREPRSPA
jgi:class 3 adenylate cyclase/tetratricopeptide (TPR) repeat protein